MILNNKQINLMFLCMSLSALTFSTTGNISKYSQIALVGYLLCSSSIVLLKILRNISAFEKKILVCLFVFVFVQLINCFRYFSYYSFVSIVQSILIIFSFLYIANMNMDNVRFTFIRIITSVFITLGYSEIIKQGFNYKSGLFGSSNSLAGIFLFLLLINVVLTMIENGKTGYSLVLLIIPIIFSSHSRTSVFVFFIVAFSYVILAKFDFSKRKLRLLFVFCTVLVILIIFVYPILADYSFYYTLNQYSVEWFGKNIESSRGTIWGNILISLDGNLISGLGTGLTYNIVNTYEGSSHNQYMQLLLQNGLIGLSILFSLFFIIWNEIINFKDKINMFCIACFIGIIFYNCFESSLIQNKVAIGCMQWFVLGIGVGRSLRYRNSIVHRFK